MFSDDTIAIAVLISGGGPRKKPLPALVICYQQGVAFVNLVQFSGAGQRTAIYNCNSLTTTTTTTTTTTSSSRNIKAFIMKHYSAAAARNLPFRSSD
ncbi:hypothetical protein T10_4267 [Trichinella papuae]|uniref:Uncharacterized protein n=1 Tax=Trichinella papuae TaxID=268474 RepID=A0A0V1N4R6_9BILA|nr:hypothetical protein T10_4267 [Trichinella papuae]